MRSLVISVLIALGTSACQHGSGAAAQPPAKDFDERQACTADADCAVVEIECCDHCNGGTAIGVHRDSATDVKAEYAGPAVCGGTACTEMACSAPTAICRQQRCGVSIAGHEQMTPLPRPPAR